MGIDYRKILIIQLQPVGDVLRATPVVSGLRKKYPKAFIGFLILDRYSEILEGNPKIDEIFLLKRSYYREKIKEGKESIKGLFIELKDLIQRLKDIEFDLVINLHNTYLSAILAYLAKGRKALGYIITDFGWPYFTNGWTATPSHLLYGEMNVIEAYLKAVGLDCNNPELEIYLDEKDLCFRDEFLKAHSVGEDDLLIGLSPGAGVYSRRWPMERFAELGDRLMEEYNAKILIVGGPSDKKIVEGMIESMKYPPINGTKTTIKQLSALIQRCKLLITNDTGPLHIAEAVKTKIIAILGPTSSKTNSPWGVEHITLQADLDCIPCTKSNCQDLKCLKSITVEEVFTSCRRFLR